jgi:hypothetical protein
VRKALVTIGWLALIPCPALIGLLVLEAITSKPVIYHAPRFVTHTELSPDGRTLAASDLDGKITLFDVESRQPRATLDAALPHPVVNTWYAAHLAFSPDGSRIAALCFDDVVRIWDPVTGQEQCALRGSRGRGSCDAFTPDGKLVMSGEDKTIRLRDVNTGEETVLFDGAPESVHPLVLSPNGKLIVVTDGKVLKVLNTATRQELAPLSESSWSRIVFSADCRILAILGSRPYGHLSLWDVETGQRRQFDHPLEASANWLSNPCCIQFSPDGARLILCSRDAKFADDDDSDSVSLTRVEIWDAATGKKTHALGQGSNQLYTPSIHLRYWLRNESEPEIASVLFMPDGRLVTLERDGSRIGMREIDSRMPQYYRVSSFLIAAFTLALAVLAVRRWFATGLVWQVHCLLCVASGTWTLFLGWYLSVFWVEAWGENTMPTDLFLFTHEFWGWFLGILLVALSLSWRIRRQWAYQNKPRSEPAPELAPGEAVTL